MNNRRLTDRRALLFAASLALAALVGCRSSQVTPNASKPGRADTTGWPRTITDETGATITLPSPPRRIVSLAPSNTELLFALGAGDSVVADTESCDYPPEARKLPHIGGMSAGDLERVQVQFPDLVVTVGSINQKLTAALRAAHIPTLSVQPRTTDDVYSSIRLIGRAVGKEGVAERLAEELQFRMQSVRHTTMRAKSRPSTLIVYSANPIYTSPPDSFIHDISAIAGGDDIVREALPQNIISPAVVVERAPDVIICSPTLRERLRRIPGWGAVPAVKNNRFFSTSGDAELTRPGPRLGLAAEQLAHYLHPELYSSTAGGGTH